MDVTSADLAINNIKVKRSSLTHALQSVTDRVCQRATVDTLDDTVTEVRILCAVLEQIVHFRTKTQQVQSFAVKQQKLGVWHFFNAALSDNDRFSKLLHSLSAITSLRNQLAKARGFLRLVLIDKSLDIMISYLLANRQETIRRFYHDGSFFSDGGRSSSVSRIFMNAAFKLSSLDFNFDLRSQSTLNMTEIAEVDYAALYCGGLDEEYSPYTSSDEREVNYKKVSTSQLPVKDESAQCLELEQRIRSVIERNAVLDDIVRENRVRIERLIAENDASNVRKRMDAIRSAHVTRLLACEQGILKLQSETSLARESHARELMVIRQTTAAVRPAVANAILPVTEPMTTVDSRASPAKSSGSPRSETAKSTSTPSLQNKRTSESSAVARALAQEDLVYVDTLQVPPAELAIPSLRAFAAVEYSSTSATDAGSESESNRTNDHTNALP